MIRFLLTAALLAVFSGLACSGSAGEPTIPTVTPGQPVTLDEYADFACPYCARFAQLALPQIEQDFAAELGDGRLVYRFRHFPILGEWSWAAAAGAECAKRQGKFQQYHDAVFASIAQEDQPGLREIAGQVGLDEAQLNDCLAAPETHQAVEQDAEEATSLGIRGTPTLVLNGRLLQWETYPHLKAILEQALGK